MKKTSTNFYIGPGSRKEVDKFLGHGSRTEVDKFFNGPRSNMSDSEKIKMYKEQHAIELKLAIGMTPDQLQRIMDYEAKKKVMECNTFKE